ncbi:MAG: peptide deformylase [Proteobacteria bacterium]|nr:peptide deformylase [Pseudomonadota bacterium]
MAVLRILQYPDPRLKKKAKWVDQVDDQIRQVVNDMFDTHYNAQNCAALAATQLDFSDPFRITVIDFSDNKNEPLCLINPEIIYREGQQVVPEGCMSVGGDVEERIFEYVKRAMNIRVKAIDIEGKPFEMDASGFMAQCIQHEIDHLDGYLYLDRLSDLKRERLQKKLHKFIKK